MNASARDVERLHRYYDGEMSWPVRQWFGFRLRRSPALRAELAAIERVAAAVEQAAAEWPQGGTPDLWPAIAASLPVLDAELGGARQAAEPRADAGALTGPGRQWGVGWRGLAAVAAAASVAVFVGLGMPGGHPETPGAVAPSVAGSQGVVRYLDSRGAAVMVIEDGESDMTIVWMMDPV